jgi:hypothetical protein
MSIIPVGQEPWVGAHIYFDEVGNSFNDPAQQVFAFAGLIFASAEHRDHVIARATEKRLVGPNARNPRGSKTAAEASVMDTMLDLLNPSRASALSEDKVIVSISYVKLGHPRIRDIIGQGKQSVIWSNEACFLPELSHVSGKNWVWISGALMAMANAVGRVVGGCGQFLAELHVTFDERRLDRTTASVMREVIEKRFIGKAPIEGMKRFIDECQWEALDRRINIQRLRVSNASDDTEGALRIAHWLARAAYRGLNPPVSPENAGWITRIVNEHGCNSVRDITEIVA